MSRVAIPLAGRHKKALRHIANYEAQQEEIRSILKRKGPMKAKLADIEKVVYPLQAVEVESDDSRLD